MYTIETKEWNCIVLITARGRPFTSVDIWELLGQYGFLGTFRFVDDSLTAREFGPSVVGVPFYTKQERANVPASLPDEQIRIDAFIDDLPAPQRKALKYKGVRASDVDEVSYVPYAAKAEYYATGEKKVPNVIEIPYEHDPAHDPDNLFVNFMVMKLNDGYDLIPFEQEKFIGIILGKNGGRIDSRLLTHFGQDVKSAEQSTNIQFFALTTTQKKTPLTEQQGKALADIKFIRAAEVTLAIDKELVSSGITAAEIATRKDSLEEIFRSARSFVPSVLLIRKSRPIYWDLATYLHVCLRHVKDMQVGHFMKKSYIPYRAKDLELVVEKVLANVRKEIDEHMDNRPGAPFYRTGAMCAYFNGEYYSFHIDGAGRLESFYSLAERPSQ